MIKQKELIDLNEIDQKLESFKEKQYSLNENIKVLVEKRDKFNIKSKESRQKIFEQKKIRDELNNKVKTLKQKRDKTRLQIREKIEEIKYYRQKIDSFRDKLPKRKSIDLQKEIDDIDWKIQTTTLELDEEKQLVEQVKIIATQLSKYKKIDKQKLIIYKIQTELDKLDKIANTAHEELSKIAKKSQEIHKVISLTIDELNNVKEKADQHHISYLEEKKEYEPLKDEITELLNKKKNLLKIIKEKDENKKRENEQKLKKKIKTEAQIKLKNGKKLSLQEFKIMTESEDETIKED